MLRPGPDVRASGGRGRATRRHILFDLDGTLTDPAEGITRSAVFALRSRGYPAPAPEELSWLVGPPLRPALAQLAGTTDRAEAEALVAAYRQRFVSIGILENRLYPGVAELLAGSAAAGYRLALATSKPAVFARRILRHFGLSAHFAAVAGSYLDGRRSEKAQVIRHALRCLRADPRDAVMVGDRVYDVLGARACGVAAIAVAWGYAQPGELKRAGVEAVCPTVAELRRQLTVP